jgi:hypothetical protein
VSLVYNAVAILLLLAAAYAQVMAQGFVANPGSLWGLRLLLLGLGIAIGWLGASIGILQGAPPGALFFIGFGLVHVPAACVLFLKARRGERRS